MPYWFLCISPHNFSCMVCVCVFVSRYASIRLQWHLMFESWKSDVHSKYLHKTPSEVVDALSAFFKYKYGSSVFIVHWCCSQNGFRRRREKKITLKGCGEIYRQSVFVTIFRCSLIATLMSTVTAYDSVVLFIANLDLIHMDTCTRSHFSKTEFVSFFWQQII